jgi:hypothetical protein
VKKQCQEAQVIDMPNVVREPQILAALPPPKADPPPVMEKEDRRIIFAEIDAHYLDEQKGYDTDWNDARDAKNLNVPLAWGREIRDDNFGPEVGLGIADEIKKAEEIIEKANSLIRSLGLFLADIQREQMVFHNSHEEIKKETGEMKVMVQNAANRIADLRKRLG